MLRAQWHQQFSGSPGQSASPLCARLTLPMGTRMRFVSSAMRLLHRDRYYTAPKAACEAREQSRPRAGEPHSSRNALDNALALCGVQPILAAAAGSGRWADRALGACLLLRPCFCSCPLRSTVPSQPERASHSANPSLCPVLTARTHRRNAKVLSRRLS